MTCPGCPSQWSGTLDDGREFYGRYRWGCLTISAAMPDPEDEYAAVCGPRLYEWEGGGEYDGYMDTATFLQHFANVADVSDLPTPEGSPEPDPEQCDDRGCVNPATVLVRRAEDGQWAARCGIHAPVGLRRVHLAPSSPGAPVGEREEGRGEMETIWADAFRSVLGYDSDDFEENPDPHAYLEWAVGRVRNLLAASPPAGTGGERDWQKDYWIAERQILTAIRWAEQRFGYENNSAILSGESWADVMVRLATRSGGEEVTPEMVDRVSGDLPGLDSLAHNAWRRQSDAFELDDATPKNGDQDAVRRAYEVARIADLTYRCAILTAALGEIRDG